MTTPPAESNPDTFIDIHVHVRSFGCPLRNGKPAYATPEQLLQRYDAIGVRRAVVLPGVSPECAYAPQSNEEVLQLAERYRDRFIPFCNVDPRAMTNAADAPLGELLEHYKGLGCRGIGEVCANLPFDHPLVRNLLRCAEAAGLPVTFHMATQIAGTYGLYDEPTLPKLEAALREFPALKFFGHSQAFWAEIGTLDAEADRSGYPAYPVRSEGAVVRLMRCYPNLYGDLSAGSGHNALARDEDHAVRFLDEFQDRLMFGTDICAPDTPTPLVDLLKRFRDEGRIRPEVFRKIARENAVRLLDLGSVDPRAALSEPPNGGD